MMDWRSRIHEAWSHAVQPGEHVLRDDAPTQWVDAIDAQRWLSGKKWDEIAADDHEMEVEMPLPYLSPTACCYFLGGYLLYLSKAFEDECIGDLAQFHLAGFLGSQRFPAVVFGFSPEQRKVLCEFAAAMCEKESLFGLDDEWTSKLKSGSRLLADGDDRSDRGEKAFGLN